MSIGLARRMAVVVAALLVGVLGVLYVTSRPAVGGQQVVAEFRDAFPLIEGMHVRVDGAIAGSVAKIEVTDQGLASVTLALDDTIEKPRSNATAAIRQQDTTGDSYISFDPGTGGEPLPERDGTPTISCHAESGTGPCERTLVAPRLDDLLNTFGRSERVGVQLLLTEVSQALDRRGPGLNRAALDMRRALEAGNQALTEVGEQNVALRLLIADAEAFTGQAASRRRELDRLIAALDATLGVTASETESLDAGLERLPETATRTRTTLAALTRAAVASRPLAQQLLAGAPGLASALNRAPGFLSDADAFVTDAQPTLDLTHKLVRAGAPTIEADPQRVVTGPFDLAPAISNLLTSVLGDENTFAGLFGDDCRGVGPGTLGKHGLAAAGIEPGNQLGYPAEHADRNFLRVSVVLNCEVFGLPVAPGCLAEALRAARRASGTRGEARPRRGRSAAAPADDVDPEPGDDDPPDGGRGPDPEADNTLGLGDRVPHDRPQAPAGIGDGLRAPSEQPLAPLLDYLLGN